VTAERIHRPLAWFNLPQDGQDFNAPRQALLDSLSGLPVQLVKHNGVPVSASEEIVWDERVLLSYQPE
jgi:undecaprenyl-diphosphatase